MVGYKIDVMKALEAKGYSEAKLQKERLLPYAEIERVKRGELVRLDTLDTLCKLLECDPTGLLEQTD